MMGTYFENIAFPTRYYIPRRAYHIFGHVLRSASVVQQTKVDNLDTVNCFGSTCKSRSRDKQTNKKQKKKCACINKKTTISKQYDRVKKTIIINTRVFYYIVSEINGILRELSLEKKKIVIIINKNE